ncbi:phosphatidylglycerophosphate synthetase [Sterolibacterium denitrificans]|uniref:CDP-diacylglycerol--glycerol-3-phosphate 3-phosphatidyltransferase n=1 Tax=Sterolibacterium denitrificans TaxID=157592 RepID=A0A7Z7HR49_9PROT|nr:CDP-diacylglycerol--glycerol-3-phosphate 3-phosphatidyltransferase [Sterolibacterium denitrificans]SMB26743.1 phosphatidylglycerophosphate synthetase [Sterolibacterium denitrificans]
MPFNIPILLTWTRIVLIPLFVGVFYVSPAWLSLHEQALAATLIFIIAGVTDWLDGWLARKLGQTSAFGAFLDPVADKLMVAAALIVLVQLGRIDALIAVIIISRELAVSALREWMAKIGAAESVAVSMLGKIKTVAQMLAIPLLLYSEDIAGIPIQTIGTLLITIAAVLTLWSMAYYLKMAWPEISLRSKTGK